MPDEIESSAEPEVESGAPARNSRRHIAAALVLLVFLLLLVFIPPLINVNRLQRRIAGNISASIGRPVHFDRLSLTMLPVPGFTLQNFVIDEDPAFGYEPILRADEVHAVLRLMSLWRGHPEFSRISLSEPTSVNLVHLSDGRWNIESLLFQASHVPAAPTAQRFASSAPRFPYIEAIGARVNLKLDQTKTPFSLTQAEFALWEPERNQWRLRLQATPIRSNSGPSDTGTLRIEGTLGSPNQTASSLAATPIDLRGDWKDVQLGGLTQFVTGSDAQVRGDVAGSFSIQGTLDQNKITASLVLLNARRADFIPPAPLALQAGCEATASHTFHAFSGIACYWPPADSDARSEMILSADIPDVERPEASSFRVTLPALPAMTFFNWVSVATPHPPLGLAGPGILSGELTWGSAALPGAQPGWTGELEFSGGVVSIPGQPAIPLGDITLQATQAPAPSQQRGPARQQPVQPTHDAFDLLPVELDLGGPAPAVLSGHVDNTGYVLRLSGPVQPSRLVAVGKAVPQLGEGLDGCLPSAPSPALRTKATTARRGASADSGASTDSHGTDPAVQIELTAHRNWGGSQSWCPLQADAVAGKASPEHR